MKSRVWWSAAWLFTTRKENPDEVVAARDDKTESVTNAEPNELGVCLHGRSMSDRGRQFPVPINEPRSCGCYGCAVLATMRGLWQFGEAF